MKYFLLGSLGKITKPLAQQLIAAGHQVTIVTSHAARENEIKALGANAAVGSVEDVAFLEKAFKGHDALYTMIPPKMDVTNWKEWIATIGRGYARAISNAGLKKVVHLSAMGAHMPSGCGPVSGVHFAEKALRSLRDVDILFLRPGYFYTNLFHPISMIKSTGYYGNNYGAGRRIVMAHHRDIAAIAAQELQKLDFTGHRVQYIASDERTSEEIVSVLGAAVDMPGLRYVAFNDEEFLQGILQTGLSKELARNFVEFGMAIRSGEMFTDYERHRPVLSPTKLEDFAKEFAQVYRQR